MESNSNYLFRVSEPNGGALPQKWLVTPESYLSRGINWLVFDPQHLPLSKSQFQVTIDDQRYLYAYDAFNRRLSKTAYTSDHIRSERYLYQEQMEIGAVNSDGILTQFRAFGIGLGAEMAAAVLVELNGKAYAPIHDHSGHVVALVDAETGDTTEHYRYSAFGEEEHPTFLNPWRFASKRCDLETKLKCSHLLASPLFPISSSLRLFVFPILVCSLFPTNRAKRLVKGRQ